MLSLTWLTDSIWDKSGLKRALQRVDEEERETKRQVEAARASGASQPELQDLKDRRNYEEWDAYEDVGEIQTRQLRREATRRHIAIPDKQEDSPHWLRTNKAQWILSTEEMRRLNRIIRKERQIECQLKVQAVSIVIGLVGSAAALGAVLLQFR